MKLANMFKNVSRIVLSAALVIGLAPAVVFTVGSGTAEATTYDIDGATWQVLPVYTTPTDNYNSKNVLTGVKAICKKGSGDIKVPSTLTWGDAELPVVYLSGFENCTSVTSVVMPETITKIGNRTFLNCTSLKSVAGASNVKMIFGEAFKGCASLENIDLDSENVEFVEDMAFDDCSYSFESPYLEETHDGNRSLAIEARIKGYLYKEAAIEAVKYLNELRSKEGLSQLKIDANLMEYAERRAEIQPITGQSHSDDGFVDNQKILTDGHGHYTGPCREIASGAGISTKKWKSDSKKLGKKAVNIFMGDPTHWAALYEEEHVYVGVGIFQLDNPNGGGVVIDFDDNTNKKWVVKEMDTNVSKIAEVDKTEKLCVSSEYYAGSTYDDYAYSDTTRICGTPSIVDSRDEVANKPKQWNKIDYRAWLQYPHLFYAKGVTWSTSDKNVAKITYQDEWECKVKLLKPGTYNLSCTIPTTKGKVLTVALNCISEKEIYTPVTYTDKNGTVYTQIKKGKRALAATGLTATAKIKKTVSVALPSGVTINGKKWTVTKVSKDFLKGSAATMLKLYDPSVSIAKGILKGTKVKRVHIAHAGRDWHYKTNFSPETAKRIKKAEIKKVTKASKKRSGKNVKVTACW